MTLRAVVRGVGHYLPARIVPNNEFEATLETTDEWIRARTGIERRHLAAEGELTSDLAAHAARAALADAGLGAETIDALIVATSTPDLTFPATATIVQAAIGMTGGFAFDVQAVCAGFVFALANAQALIVSGQARRVLVIGAETFSRIMDWTDRGTCVLFGDGRFRDLLYVDGGVSATGTAGHLRMQGNAVFKHAVQKLAETAHSALHKAGLSGADVDWIVPHQANLRIIAATAERMQVPMDRVVVTVQDHGNTSAASIPLAMSVGKARGQIKEGDLLVAEAIGGGLAWGSVVLRW
jgi:3-oxoacyl-[acyl-carrier-protein] synthase-3